MSGLHHKGLRVFRALADPLRHAGGETTGFARGAGRRGLGESVDEQAAIIGRHRAGEERRGGPPIALGEAAAGVSDDVNTEAGIEAGLGRRRGGRGLHRRWWRRVLAGVSF